MLQINGLTYRIQGRLIFDDATAVVPTGHKAGLVGRNGSGKTTLLKLITGEMSPEAGTVSVPRRARIGGVAQEAPGGSESLLEVVLAADKERSSLLEAAETADDPHDIADIQTRLADISAHSAPARAATILSGLGFAPDQQHAPCSGLSGGWRMRVALAAALFAAPDILLLDEPTNYLDLEGTIWLKSFIRDYPYTVVIVSHDRDLLNDAVDSILHLDRCRLTFYQGNYDSFDKQRREKQALLMKFKKKQDEARRHMQSFVDRFRYKASKARQAQSRLKAIAKLEPITEMIEDRVARFIFPEPKKPLNPPLIRLEHAAAGYIEGNPVLNDLDLRIDSDDRIALLGQNGNGKSTLAKVLCGRLALAKGTMHHHKQLAVGYFAQHQIDELDETLSPYDYFRRLMPDNSEAQRRAKLGLYGFGSVIADSKCAVLSGGEKARLLFALASFHAPHLLVLDEPTNHLDVDSREALIHAINDYEGCVVLISHDKHLIETTVDRLWLVAEGTVRPFDGDIDDYTRQVLDQARGGRRARAGQKANGRATGDAGRQQATKLLKKVREIDSRLAEINEKIGILDRALADEGLYAQDPKQARKFSGLRAELQGELERLEHHWLEAQSALEAEQS